jgi:hypothetical protein
MHIGGRLRYVPKRWLSKMLAGSSYRHLCVWSNRQRCTMWRPHPWRSNSSAQSLAGPTLNNVHKRLISSFGPLADNELLTFTVLLVSPIVLHVGASLRRDDASVSHELQRQTSDRGGVSSRLPCSRSASRNAPVTLRSAETVAAAAAAAAAAPCLPVCDAPEIEVAITTVYTMCAVNYR